MKQGWEIKTLSQVYDVRDGTHHSPRYHKTGYPLITPKHLKNDSIDFSNIKYISETDYLNINKRSKVDTGDVLFAMIGTIGHPIVITDDIKFAIKNIALFKVPQNQDSYFLKYYLDSDFVIRKMTRDAKGATQKFVGLGYLRNFPIPIPPLREQKNIVAIIEEAFTAIDQAISNAEKNRQNARHIFDAFLQNTFANPGRHWVEKKLRDISEINPNKREAREKLKETDSVTFLPMENLAVLNKDIIGIKEKMLKEVEGSYAYFANNDVLLAKITPCFENGKIGIARNLLNGIGFGSSEFIVFRPKEGIIPEYIYYFLSRKQIRDQGSRLMTGAVGHKRVSKDWIENYLIPFPKDLNEQQAIVQKMDTLSANTKKLESIYQQKLIRLRELKKSILQKAFSGELILSANPSYFIADPSS
jgi:type I restriction enzyme, S subunit